MTKQELEQKIKELENQIAELKNAKVEDKVLEPENGEKYWCVLSSGDVEWYIWHDDNAIDTFRYEQGNCFKTEEEAEFSLKYQNITRTETLSLPTWEEIQKTHGIVFFRNECEFMLQYQPISKKIAVYERNNRGDYYLEEATKENYLQACEICRKLFLGEIV